MWCCAHKKKAKCDFSDEISSRVKPYNYSHNLSTKTKERNKFVLFLVTALRCGHSSEAEFPPHSV